MNEVVFLKNKIRGAWDPIIKGYQSAFIKCGFTVREVEDVRSVKSDDYLFLKEWDVDESMLSSISESKKTFLFVQPQHYDLPWGNHPNFISNLDFNFRKELASLENIYKWTFADLRDKNFKNYYSEWGNVNSVPLAYDNINYKEFENDNYGYDVCFIGGWADNGFNEKKKLILQTLKVFMNSDLKCGFFINRGISHDAENKILSNSRVCLNVHDKYQRKFGRDVNERTFKSLGLNGILVSDEINHQTHLFPEIKCSNNPESVLKYVKEYVNMDDDRLEKIKNKNKQNILTNHTYVNRVKQMLNE